MRIDPTKWGRSHQALFRSYCQSKSNSYSLPKLPTDLLEWKETARPTVEGKPRNFLAAPFWLDIYRDPFRYKMIVGGRQIYKSTYLTDVLACEATSIRNNQLAYITNELANLSSFTKQKLRDGTFDLNLILEKFLKDKNNTCISLKNGSVIYCMIGNYEYRHLEGKSPTHCILDEAQYHQIQYLAKVIQSMTATKGKLTIAGIGGEAGSPYENLWLQTDQREWEYDDKNWRDKLQFDSKGLVVGEYLNEVLRGKWVPRKPENSMYHGYHLPQTIFPDIPLTIEDAIKKYKTHPPYSIEYKQKNDPNSVFTTHVLGEFYKATRRPVTREMVLACMTPYRYLGLLSAQEIAELKDTFANKIKVCMGVDFGSGNPSNTVIVILIHWRKSDRYQLAYLDKRPQENQLDQAEMINKLFKDARCDIGVGDLGYGVNQVKLIQDGGANRLTGELYEGVGSNRFIGCRSAGDETKPMTVIPDAIDEHGEQMGRITIDKTTSIQEFIDMLETYKQHPSYPPEDPTRRPQLMIPFLTSREFDTDWLIKDFTDITRKDISQTDDVTMTDPRQRPKKEYNHPKDSVMAIIYARVAMKQEVEWHYFSV